MDPRVAKCLLVSKVLVADGIMTENERAFLDKMMRGLGLDEDERRRVLDLEGWDQAEPTVAKLSDDEKRELVSMLVDASSADGRLSRDRDRNRAAHREPEEEHALGADLPQGRLRVLDAPVEPPPRAHAVAHLGERELGQQRGEGADEPLDRRAPRPLQVARLPAVHAEDEPVAAVAGPAQLGARREPGHARAGSS